MTDPVNIITTLQLALDPVSLKSITDLFTDHYQSLLKNNFLLFSALEKVEWIGSEFGYHCPFCHREKPEPEPDPKDPVYTDDDGGEGYAWDFNSWMERRPGFGHAEDCKGQAALKLNAECKIMVQS
jgi:hypothetical protein